MTFEYHHAVADPAYGSRIFRRRIRIERRGSAIAAGLEDNMHALKLVMELDGDIISSIEGTWYRHPNVSCRGAPKQLASFIGRRLTADRLVFREYADVRQQCTHFHDLLGLAMCHALRDEAVRQYDVAIPDMVEGKTWAEVQLNGVAQHRWDIDHATILGPEYLKGRPLEKGFSRWAAEEWSGDRLEAAQVLQMGIFVSRAAHLDFKAMAAKFPGIVLAPPQLAGACYALQPERAHEALPSHDIRDFTQATEEMLKFL